MVYQERFLGSSIRNYSASIGWNEQPSEIRIGLVDDNLNNDTFLGYPFYNGANAYYPGQHAIFWHQNTFNFGGIIQSMERTRSSEGNPIYEVTMRDPRFILDGVQLITNDYTGSILGFSNIFNIYGYWESTGFGNSLANDTGIPWYQVAVALGNLLNNPNANYGSYVTYRGQAYGVYMPSLPYLPTDYRVGGSGSMSLMEFIQEICDAGGYDWFCNLEINTAYANPLIVIYIISRNVALATGAIEQYTENIEGCVSNSAGIELVDSVAAKLLIGGNREDVWFSNEVIPYWGTDTNGNVIIGNSNTNQNDYTVELDSSTWAVYGIGNTYITDVAELRAAADSQESWEALLWFRNVSSYPQAGRAANLGIVSNVNENIVAVINNTPANKLSALQFANLKPAPMNRLLNFDANKNRKNLYDIVKSVAVDYFGKKFMVAIPSLYFTVIPGTIEQRSTRTIVQSAYLDESIFDSAIGNGYIPEDINGFTTDEGKFICFVRFDNAQNYDFSEINDDDKYVQYNAGFGNYSVFVKCQVEESPVFYNNATAYSPRAVITLPGAVREASNGAWTYTTKDNVGVIRDFLLEQGINSAKIDSLLSSIGGDAIAFGREAMPISPSLAAIPMKSNIECYGPWWSGNGVDGRVEFEKDDTLVPWNFGGYSTMDTIAYAKVLGVVSNQPWSETGHIEFPGVPQQNLGGQLLTSGPYVSDISCYVGEDGIKTSYRFNRYTPSFGRLSRYNIDKFSKFGKAMRDQKRNLRNLYKKENKIAAITAIKNNFFKSMKANRDKSNSSHQLICGQLLDSKYDVATQPVYNAMMQLYYEYETKAGMSLDGLLRPISTNPDDTNFPHFEDPTTDVEPTASTLNPYQGEHDIQCVVHGSSLPTDLVLANAGSFPSAESYRPLALRGPLVLTAWGYDINDKPVPNENPDEPTDTFLDGWLKKSIQWKTGPVDLRWDDERKVWTSAPVRNKIIVTMDSVLHPGLSATATDNDSGDSIEVHDPMEINFLLIGESVYVEYNVKEDRYEVAGSFGLTRRVTPQSGIDADSSGTCDVFSSIGQQDEINVYLDWMHGGESIDSGVEAIAQYFTFDQKWRFIGAACNAQ